MPSASLSLCALLSAIVPAAPAPPPELGTWGPELGMCETGSTPGDCMTAIHAVLLATGQHKSKVLIVDGLTSQSMTDPRPDIALFDPNTDPPTITTVWDTKDHPPGLWPNDHRLYCSGHMVLGGKVFFRGGDETPGNERTTIY